MAHQLVSRIGASPLWRAGLAIVFILGLAAFAGAVIPEACRSGAVMCSGESDAAAPEVLIAADAPAAEPTASEAVASSEPAPDGAGDAVEVAAMDTVLAREPAALMSNDLVAATFAALDAGLVATSTELATRRVRTVTVGPDGQPLADAGVPEVAPLVAEAEVSTEPVPAEPAAEEPAAKQPAAEEPAADEPAPVVEPSSSEPGPSREASAEPSSEEVSAVAYAPVREGNAVVTGKGANVRALPKKGGSDVLFALNGGEEVTVVEMSKGWAKIVDARGRSGWIYGDYLRR